MVIFVVAILASIGLHELGHMIPAKKFGGKVTQYFIGFGPTVWSTQRGETEYGVKAIPLGGYVKIVGMLPPGAEELDEERETRYDEDGNRVIRVRKSNTGLFTQLISDARAAEWEHIEPEDSDRLFYKMAWWKKVIVMAGGPTVNILIAFFIFLGRLRDVRPAHRRAGGRPARHRRGLRLRGAVRRGRPGLHAPRTRSPRPRTPGSSTATRSCRSTAPRSTDWTQLQKMIRENDDGQAVIVVERDGARSPPPRTRLVTPRPTSATDATEIEVGFLGVVARPPTWW